MCVVLNEVVKAFGAERAAGGGVRVLGVMQSHTADDVCTLLHTTAATQQKNHVKS